MKTFSLFWIVIFNSLQFLSAQKFTADTEYFDAVDRWTALKVKDSVDTYIYGFIYFDEQAGFTYEIGELFRVNERGNLVRVNQTVQETSKKFRIPPKWGKVALLSDQNLQELNLPKIPDWLASYKKNDKTSAYLLKLGYAYNHVGASHQALKPLLEAYKINPKEKGLNFEIAFAYNAIREHEKALNFLETALKNEPEECGLHREKLYALKYSNRLQDAENSFDAAKKVCANNKQALSEIGLNMALGYLETNNAQKFKEWMGFIKANVPNPNPYGEYIQFLESEWEKKNKP